MTPFDYSADLDITHDDVDTETNIDVLNKWALSLWETESAILNLHLANSWKELPAKAKSKYRRIFIFRKYIRSRIALLINDERKAAGYQSERSRRKDRTLVAKFMEVAKRELPKEEYKRLLSIAQTELAEKI